MFQNYIVEFDNLMEQKEDILGTLSLSISTGLTPASVWRANSLSRNHENLSSENNKRELSFGEHL